MISITSDTLDDYKGLHYFMCAITDKSKHKEPYLVVDHDNKRIARIMLRDRSINFYGVEPSPVIGRIIQEWISKENNYTGAVRRWNKLNPRYSMTEV